MLSDKLIHLFNKQVRNEGEASQLYLSMYTWACEYGLENTAKFYLEQAAEEQVHMHKILTYLNDRGERAYISQLDAPEKEFTDLKTVFEASLKAEQDNTEALVAIKRASMEEGDGLTCSFIHWFMMEQIEEEALMQRVLDRIKHAKNHPAGELHVDNFLATIRD